MIIFTSICANYVHKARTLAKSVKEHIPDAKFIVCLVEREIDPRIQYEHFDRIVLAGEAWEGNFNRFIFKHTIVEASTSVKGQFFRFLYKNYPSEHMFVYLDPDTYVYSDFAELRELLRNQPIILCPHLLEPGNIDMELSSTSHGVYNLGFLAVNRSEEAQRFIDWWAERLYLFCYDDIANGIFTDQKWIDLAPCFFNVHILKHRGYDFAPWSLLNSEISVINGQYYVKGDPLRFIHFSGYGASIEKCMREWLPDGDHLFKKLYKEYSTVHDSNDFDGVSMLEWSYGYYLSGETVSDSVRKEYRKDYNVMFSIENPYEYSNEYFIRRLSISRIEKIPYKVNRLIKKSIQVIKTEGMKSFVDKSWKKLKQVIR